MNLGPVFENFVLCRLNPLGIGDGFEHATVITTACGISLNPLGIGEGFELNVPCKLTGTWMS